MLGNMSTKHLMSIYVHFGNFFCSCIFYKVARKKLYKFSLLCAHSLSWESTECSTNPSSGGSVAWLVQGVPLVELHFSGVLTSLHCERQPPCDVWSASRGGPLAWRGKEGECIWYKNWNGTMSTRHHLMLCYYGDIIKERCHTQLKIWSIYHSLPC